MDRIKRCAVDFSLKYTKVVLKNASSCVSADTFPYAVASLENIYTTLRMRESLAPCISDSSMLRWVCGLIFSCLSQILLILAVYHPPFILVLYWRGSIVIYLHTKLLNYFFYLLLFLIIIIHVLWVTVKIYKQLQVNEYHCLLVFFTLVRWKKQCLKKMSHKGDNEGKKRWAAQPWQSHQCLLGHLGNHFM